MGAGTSAEEFFLKSINVESIFEFVERTDYLFLYSIKECVEKSDCHEGVYLSEVAEYMKLSIPETSKMVKSLENKGYIIWKLDEKKERATLAISSNDRKRIIRILEIYHSTGKTKTEQEIESRKNEVPYNYLVFAINMDKEKLHERINKRVDIMIKDGLIEEVKGLLEKYKQFPTAMQGLGYKEVVEYINGSISKQEMIDKIKNDTRKYAKRQLTWFRKNKQTIWLNGLDELQNNLKIILEEYK